MSTSPFFEVWLIFGRVVVGGVFVLAGLLKIKAGSLWFHKTLLAYDLMHERIALLLSKSLPWAEAICGALLILGLFTSIAAVAGFIILLVFILAIASAILRDKPVDCGCFGRTTKVSRARWTLVYRNIVLMGLLLPVYAFAGGSLSVDELLKVWLSGPNRDTFSPTWLVGLWIVSLSMALMLHALSRRRADKAGSREITGQV